MLNPEDRLKVLKTLFNAAPMEESSGSDGAVHRSQFGEEQLGYLGVLVMTGLVRGPVPESSGYRMEPVVVEFFVEMFGEGSVLRTVFNSPIVDILAEHKVICRNTPLDLEWNPIQTQP